MSPYSVSFPVAIHYNADALDPPLHVAPRAAPRSPAKLRGALVFKLF